VTNRTQLAAGEILNGIILSIWLVQPAGKPESVVVIWPQRSTAVSPRHYSELAATLCRLVANASTELAAIKAGKRRS
jgi:anti-sigma-K factor RskA